MPDEGPAPSGLTSVVRLAHAVALACALLLAGAPGCAVTGPQPGDDVLEQGVRAAESTADGAVDRAIQILEGGVSEHPRHLGLRFELARLQYEKGEASHLQERQTLRNAAVFAERSEREQALTYRRSANEHRARATPFYQAARDNLTVVIDRDADEHRIAWASVLLMRIAVFFEDWEAAHEHVDRAIQLGHPTGPLLAQWREFQAELRARMESGRVR